MRCRSLFVALCAALLSPLGNAAPPSLATALELQGLPLHVAPQPLIDKALAQSQAKPQPLRIAVAIPMSLSLRDGLWDEPNPGLSRWRSQVSSHGAKFLALTFSDFALPAAAELWLYDAHGGLMQGPYTAASRNTEGMLWTALVPTDTVVIELQVPTANLAAVQLQLTRIDHGIRPFDKAGVTGGNAGSCNIDAACSQGNSHRDQIRSVAVYTIDDGSGMLVCTGQLVNNMRQDATPYFLSAHHCGARNNAGSMVLYWNFQRSSCGSGTGSMSQTQSGAVFRAGDSRSDFALVQLNQRPLSAFNVFYTGWDVTSTPPQSGAAIHHPAGDVKKVSLYTAAATPSDGVLIAGRPTDAWEVHWSQGTTEGGSSGAGLYNQNRQIVGVLSGGDASCSNRNGPDYFGRLSNAWQASAARNGQLKAWLDPDNTGRTTLCGQNPGAPCAPDLISMPDPSAAGGAPGLWLLAALGMVGLFSAARACRVSARA